MFSTAFDFNSADFLAKLDIPIYKIASGDLKNIPLLTHIAGFQKPMILSTGGGTMEDVNRAYDAIMPINQQLCILQCTAGYPAEFDELNLRVITTFRERFPDCTVGLSSHDNGIAMAVAAYMLGAQRGRKTFYPQPYLERHGSCFFAGAHRFSQIGQGPETHKSRNGRRHQADL